MTTLKTRKVILGVVFFFFSNVKWTMLMHTMKIFGDIILKMFAFVRTAFIWGSFCGTQKMLRGRQCWGLVTRWLPAAQITEGPAGWEENVPYFEGSTQGFQKKCYLLLLSIVLLLELSRKSLDNKLQFLIAEGTLRSQCSPS